MFWLVAGGDSRAEVGVGRQARVWQLLQPQGGLVCALALGLVCSRPRHSASVRNSPHSVVFFGKKGVLNRERRRIWDRIIIQNEFEMRNWNSKFVFQWGFALK